MAEIEITTIGTELLLGAIQDTNTAFIARCLNEAGFEIHRATVVGDNVERIAQAINDALSRADGVITTGGLGPTVDDPTRAAVALAFNVNLEFHEDLWNQIVNRFSMMERTPTENNRKQAYLPAGAIAIPNPVGTAPAFIIRHDSKVCVSLPGVPAEMKFLLQTDVIPRLQALLNPESIIASRVVHTAGIGESALDEIISDLEKLPNPTIGLSAHPSQVDIRITAKAENKKKALELIDPIINDLSSRLGKFIYGFDDETIFNVINNILEFKQYRITFEFQGEPFPFNLIQKLRQLEISKFQTLVKIKLELDISEDEVILSMLYSSSNGEKFEKRRFIQHNSQFERWSENVILNFIRENILEN